MIDALCVAIAIDFTELIARLKSKDSVLPRFTGLYNCFNDNAQKQDKIECFEFYRMIEISYDFKEGFLG